MAKNKKLSLDDETLLYILQLALDSALEQKDKAMSHHDQVASGFHIAENIDMGSAMAIKEISESLEKFLKSSDQSLDKIIKIARLIADTMRMRTDDDSSEMTDEEKEEMQASITKMVNKAKEAKEVE